MKLIEAIKRLVWRCRGAVRPLGLFAAAAVATVAFSEEACAQFTGPGIYNISIAQTSDALDIDTSWGRGGNAGQPLIRWGRHNGANQTFVVFAEGGGFIMRPLHSIQCVDVRAAATTAGTPLQQFPCHGGANQRFFISTGPTTVIRPAHASGMLLFARGGTVVLAPTPTGTNPLLVGMVFIFNRI